MKGVRSMDEMNIQSKFMTGLVSRIVKKVLRAKLGCEVDIQLNEFRTTVIDDKTHVHLDLDADLTKEELNKLLKTIKIFLETAGTLGKTVLLKRLLSFV